MTVCQGMGNNLIPCNVMCAEDGQHCSDNSGQTLTKKLDALNVSVSNVLNYSTLNKHALLFFISLYIITIREFLMFSQILLKVTEYLQVFSLLIKISLCNYFYGPALSCKAGLPGAVR